MIPDSAKSKSLECLYFHMDSKFMGTVKKYIQSMLHYSLHKLLFNFSLTFTSPNFSLHLPCSSMLSNLLVLTKCSDLNVTLPKPIFSKDFLFPNSFQSLPHNKDVPSWLT